MQQPEMVFIQGTPFKMGGLKQKTAGDLSVSDFYLGKYPVTARQFKTFVEETNFKTDAEQTDGLYGLQEPDWEYKKGLNWRHNVHGKVRSEREMDHPVMLVSLNDAMAYCRWLSEKSNQQFRLPTEAEWEFAARGGSECKNYLFAGSNDVREVAWYWENSGSKKVAGEWTYENIEHYKCETHIVGQKKPNELGLHDMSGNVWEWCSDWFDVEYPPKFLVMHNPKGPETGTNCVNRGGGWASPAMHCANDSRSFNNPDAWDRNLGFRIAMEIPATV